MQGNGGAGGGRGVQNGGTGRGPQSAKKHRRRLSDGGKAGGKRAISR